MKKKKGTGLSIVFNGDGEGRISLPRVLFTRLTLMQTASFQRTLQFRFSGQQPSHYRLSAKKKIKSTVRLDQQTIQCRVECCEDSDVVASLDKRLASLDTWEAGFFVRLAHLTKQPAFHDSSSGVPAKWRPSNKPKIPYWWRVTTQIWVVDLIGWSKYLSQHNQSEALLWPRQWHVISMKFVPSFLRRHFAGKPVVPSRNVGHFLRLKMWWIWLKNLEKSISSTAVGVSCFFKILYQLHWDFKKPSPKHIYE